MQPLPAPAPVVTGPVSQRAPATPYDDGGAAEGREFGDVLTDARTDLARRSAHGPSSPELDTSALVASAPVASAPVASDPGAEAIAPAEPDTEWTEAGAVPAVVEAPEGAAPDTASEGATVVGGLAGAGPTFGGVTTVPARPDPLPAVDRPVGGGGETDASVRASTDPSPPRGGGDAAPITPSGRALDEILRQAILKRGAGGRMPHPADPVPALATPEEAPSELLQMVEQSVVDAVHALDPGTHGRIVAATVTETVGAPARVPGLSDPHGPTVVEMPGAAVATDPASHGRVTQERAGGELPDAAVVDVQQRTPEPIAAEYAPSGEAPAVENPASAPSPSEADVAQVDALTDVDAPGSIRTDQSAGTTATSPIELRRVAQLVERIEQWVDRVRSAPPPNVLTVRPEGQEGYAIRIALESGSLHVTVDGAQPDEVAWVRQALEQLARRGMDLGGFETSHSRDEQQPFRDERRPGSTPDAIPTASAARGRRSDDALRL